MKIITGLLAILVISVALTACTQKTLQSTSPDTQEAQDIASEQNEAATEVDNLIISDTEVEIGEMI